MPSTQNEIKQSMPTISAKMKQLTDDMKATQNEIIIALFQNVLQHALCARNF